jgi:hypothetical protein
MQGSRGTPGGFPFQPQSLPLCIESYDLLQETEGAEEAARWLQLPVALLEEEAREAWLQELVARVEVAEAGRARRREVRSALNAIDEQLGELWGDNNYDFDIGVPFRGPIAELEAAKQAIQPGAQRYKPNRYYPRSLRNLPTCVTPLGS